MSEDPLIVLLLLRPVVNAIPLPLLAYYIAVLRGCDEDRPRNSATDCTHY